MLVNLNSLEKLEVSKQEVIKVDKMLCEDDMLENYNKIV